MGTIINPRGTAGSGKTALVRALMADYGWRPGAPEGPRLEPVRRAGRRVPIAYRLAHPAGGRPLAVLGHYEGQTRGGCDTIVGPDGGLEAVFDLAARFAADGHDVLLEGLVLSGDVDGTAALAARAPVHVLRLGTPEADCVRHLAIRRRAGPLLRPVLAGKVAAETERLDAACARLLGRVPVEVLSLAAARDRARQLLGLPTGQATAGGAPFPTSP